MLTLNHRGLSALSSGLRRIEVSGIDNAVESALQKSILHVQMESQKRTPVDTGYLKSSIGGRAGFSGQVDSENATSIASGAGYLKVQGDKAIVGTNVEYAAAVHEIESYSHDTGGAKYMERGAKEAVDEMDNYFSAELQAMLNQEL